MTALPLAVAAALVARWASRVEDGAPGWRNGLGEVLVCAAVIAAGLRVREMRRAW